MTPEEFAARLRTAFKVMGLPDITADLPPPSAELVEQLLKAFPKEMDLLKNAFPVPVGGSKCSACNKDFVSHAGILYAINPREGDLTVCFECGEIQMFTAGLKTRPMTKEDIDECRKTSPDAYREALRAKLQVKERQIRQLHKEDSPP